MSSFFKNKAAVFAAIAAALVLAVVGISHFLGLNPVDNVVRTVLSPFQTGTAFISNKISGAISFLWEMDSYKTENDNLSEKIVELQSTNRDIAQYREENERLKALLGLQQELTQYSTVAASVIGYSDNNRYDKIEISRGSISGVAVGNTVISKDGVVGMVTEVGTNWATVSTILEKENAMGVKIIRTGDVAVLEGDEELAQNNLCKMTFVNSTINIIVGDIIETSGSGGIYPAGLEVGRITDINADNMGQINYATIKPSVDFDKLHEVLIINGIN